jgi:hypothetical protein
MTIKLTDEQFREIDNIFDVQGIGIPENLIKATANMAFELLTDEQVKQLAESKGMYSGDELKAHCERLRNCLMKASAMDPDRIGFEKCLGKTLASTPQQSLAEIKAQAIEEWVSQCRYMEGLSAVDIIDSAYLFIDELRETE